ncbi:hypothetical protein RCL1_006855 [Eukaryota sp. TZLM3-RCL]
MSRRHSITTTSPFDEEIKTESLENIIERLERQIDAVNLEINAETETAIKHPHARSAALLQDLHELKQVYENERKTLLDMVEQQKTTLGVDVYDEPLSPDDEPRKAYRGYRDRSDSVTSIGHFQEDVEPPKELERELKKASIVANIPPVKPIRRRKYKGELLQDRHSTLERTTPTIITRKTEARDIGGSIGGIGGEHW